MGKDTSYSSKEKSTKMMFQFNIYAAKVRAPTFVKETFLKFKSHLEFHILIVGNFSTLHSPMDRTSKWKLNREIMKLTDIMNQMDLTDNNKISQAQKEYTFFSVLQRTFSKNWSHTRSQTMSQQIQENWTQQRKQQKAYRLMDTDSLLRNDHCSTEEMRK